MFANLYFYILEEIVSWRLIKGCPRTGHLFLVNFDEGMYLPFLSFTILWIVRMTLCVCFRVAECVFGRFREGKFFFKFFCLASRIVTCLFLNSRMDCKDVSRWMSSIPSLYGVGPFGSSLMLE